MGRESIATTDPYLHFQGTSAHSAGLDRLHASARGNVAAEEQLGGTSEVVALEGRRDEPEPVTPQE